MAIEEVCLLSAVTAKRELKRLAKFITFGDDFVQGVVGWDPRTYQDGYALSAMFDLACSYRRCAELADYLHEETEPWKLWKEIKRAYAELKERWMPKPEVL